MQRNILRTRMKITTCLMGDKNPPKVNKSAAADQRQQGDGQQRHGQVQQEDLRPRPDQQAGQASEVSTLFQQ